VSSVANSGGAAAVNNAPRPIEDFEFTLEEQHNLYRDGFLAIEDITDEEDVAEIRGLIAPWLDSEAPRPAGVLARSLGSGEADRVREVTHVTQVEPALLKTRFFRRAMGAARAMFGPAAKLMFDHVIEKSAYDGKAVEWHQDCAYGSRVTLSARRLHWWLPLQPATAENGCMQFVRGSHLGPVLPHRRVTPWAHPRATRPPSDPSSVVVCPLPVGGATVHLPKTLHYTGPNVTAGDRLAWIVQIGVRGGIPTLL
jgi:ectoine hydroxylase-related dioxygenase (phytanoyl-CoA dioxygenase family)